MSEGKMLVGLIDPFKIDPDEIPLIETMPHGFASFVGTAWSGSDKIHPIVDAQFVIGRRRMMVMMTVDQAKDMRAALNAAISTAERAFEEWPEETH